MVLPSWEELPEGLIGRKSGSRFPAYEAALHHLALVEQVEAAPHLTCEKTEAGSILTDSVGCSKPF